MLFGPLYEMSFTPLVKTVCLVKTRGTSRKVVQAHLLTQPCEEEEPTLLLLTITTVPQFFHEYTALAAIYNGSLREN